MTTTASWAHLHQKHHVRSEEQPQGGQVRLIGLGVDHVRLVVNVNFCFFSAARRFGHEIGENWIEHNGS